MEFFSVVNARRSVRKFLPEPVGRDVLGKIVAAGVEAPSGWNMQLRQYIIVDDAAVLGEFAEVGGALAGAPAAIVLLVEPKATAGGDEFWVQDVSAAMENMLLAAVALGYAGCWVEGQVHRCEDRLREVLAVPQELRVWSIMPVGRADGAAARPDKPTPAEITHYNRFGQSE